MSFTRKSGNPTTFRPLGVSLGRFASALAFCAAIVAGTGAARAAAINWDAGSGTDFNWNTVTNWSNDLLPTSADDLSFPVPFPNPGILSNPSVITLGAGELAASLSFLGSYTLTGGSLSLAAGSINVNFAETAVIQSQLTGTAGLTLAGGGGLRLTNAANTYTGTTSITNGSLIINTNGALGLDPSAILVSGSLTRGFGGGSLVLEGGYTSGVLLSRNISLSALGPITDRGASLISVRTNELSGTVSAAAGTTNTRIISTAGVMKFSGTLDIGGNATTTFSVFGGTNAAGAGQYAITGNLTGNGTIEKQGAGTLVLAPSSSAGFSGSLRLNTSATSTQSTVRISSSTALGIRTATGGNSVLDFNSGTLEIRTDTPDFTTTNFYARGTTSTLFVDHGIGSLAALLNGSVVMGFFDSDNTTMQLSGRNGWGSTWQGSGITQAGPPVFAPMDWSWSGGADATINNNSNGTLTLNLNVKHDPDGIPRTFSVGGNAETVILGNIQQTANATPTFSNPSLAKNGTGQLSMAYSGGAATPSTGSTRINTGTLAFASANALPTGTINIGNALTTSGTLTFTGVLQTLPNAISLNVTTAPVYINASGTGALTIGSTITALTGSKTIFLGGTSTADNTISSIIPSAGGVLSLQKIGSGTWVINPTASNTLTGTTTISGGTLTLQEVASNFDILPNAGAVIFNLHNFTNAAGGTLKYLGAPSVFSTETVGALTPSAGPGSIIITPGSGGTAALTFASLGAVAAGTGVNIAPAAGGSVTITGVATTTATTLPGNGHIYINGADFARSNGGAIVTPVYGTDAGFVNAAAGAATLVAASHNLVTGNITAQTLRTVSSLKLTTQTVTLTGLLTVNVGSNTSGGILQTGGSGVISGTGVTTAGTGDLVIRVNGAGDTLTLSAPITATNTGGFTKNGAGTLVLSAANAQTGTTTINEGTVRLSGSGTLSDINRPLIIRQDGTLDLNGLSSGTAIGTFNGAGTVTNSNATPATFIVGNGVTTNGVAGYFTGLLKNGTGVLNVTYTTALNTAGQTTTYSVAGAETYTGVTTLTKTTLGNVLLAVNSLADIGTASGIGAGAAGTNAASLVFSGGTLQYTGSNATIFQATQTPSVSTNRLFTLAGGGTIQSSGQYGNNVLAAGTQNNAALVFSNTGDVAFSGAAGPRSLTLGGNSIGDNTFNIHLVDSLVPNQLSLTKADAGLWILNPSTTNTYTGATTITGGALQVPAATVAAQGLPTTGNLTLAGGVLQTSGNFNRANGTLANQVQWTGVGGFAASTDTKLTVNLGGAGASLTMGASPFNTSTLILSSTTALGEVEFFNGLNLNGGTRTVQVDDNGNTASDFATISGLISNSTGTGNLSKTGGGILQLLGANTYNGTTAVTSGTLVVTSLGSSATGTGSSVGNGGVGANSAAQALTLGNGGGGAAILQYVGVGETSDRMIRLNTTNGSDQIHADGSGALVLTNVLNNMVTGAKTLFLRGSNAQANQITSNLTDNTGALGITVDGNATWVLGGANTFTGTVSVNAGALGIGSNSVGGVGAIGNGTLLVNNGSQFAYGADRTVANTVQHSDNTTTAFIGNYSLNFTGTLQLLATGGNVATTNNIAVGKTLAFNNVTANSLNGSRFWTINGTGNTIINGAISNSVQTLNLTYNPANDSNTLTLNGVSTYTGATNLQRGRTILAGGGNNRLPANTTLTLGAAANPAVLQLGNAAGPSNLTLASLAVVTSFQPNAIVGGNATVSVLTMNTAVDQTLPFALGGPNPNENNLKLVKTGPATLNVTATNTYTGGTEVGTANGIDGGRLSFSGVGTLGSVFSPTALTVFGGIADIASTAQIITNLNLGGGAAGSTAQVTINGELEVGGNITYSATNNPNPAIISGIGGLKLNPLVAPTTITVASSTAGSGGALAPDLTISAALVGTQTVRKAGPGTLRLVGNPNTTWQAPLFIDAGTLILDGSPSTPALANAVQITVGSGTKLDFGASSGEAINFKSLTLQSNSTLVFNLGAVASSDNLILNDTNGLIGLGNSGLKININALSGFGQGHYNLIDEQASIDPGNPFSLGITPGGFSYTLGRTYSGSIYDLFLDVGPASAAFYWKGSGIDRKWTTAANWLDAPSGAVTTGNPGITNDVFFSANSPLAGTQVTTIVDINLGVRTLTINDPAVATIKGVSGTILSIANGITLGLTAGAVTFGSVTPADALSLGITTTQNWTNNGTGTLTIFNQVFSQGTSGIQTLTFNGSNATVINGNIINGGLGGTISVANTSPSLTLDNSGNTYTGGTKIGGTGTVQFSAGSLPISGKVEFTGNGTLQWGTSLNPANTDDISDRLKINDTFIGTLNTNGNNVTFASTIQNGAPTSGTLTKTGAGTLKLAASNQGGGYTGGTNINAGTLEFVSGAFLNFLSTPGNVTFTGGSTLKWSTGNIDDISSLLRIAAGVTGIVDTNGNNVAFANAVNNGGPTTTGALTKTGAGTLSFNANASPGRYSGGTNIAAGTVEFVSGALPDLTPTTAEVRFTGNSTLRWLPSNTDDISARLKINAGVTATLDIASNLSSDNVVFANAVNSGPSTNGNLTKTGLGKISFAVANPNFLGATQVDAGILAVSGSLSGTTSVTVGGGATFELVGAGIDRIPTVPINMGSGGGTATLLANDGSETTGVLTISGTSVIDFGIHNGSSPNAVLKFAKSSAAVWTSTLSIFNWNGTPDTGGGVDQLFFGGDSTGLTASQLSQVLFFSDNGTTALGSATFATPGLGEIVPVPEPGSLLTLLGSAGIVLGLRRRQRPGVPH